MNREFYVPACTPYAYPQSGSGSSTEGVVVSSGGGSGGAGGMDCMALRPGPFHYLISEQAKSLVALQELQNEVGALLEFRDIVIEAFPDLRHKMGAESASTSVVMSTSRHGQASSSLAMSRKTSTEWEPGKLRRRLPREGESSASFLPRSRSNSHSGGSKNSATVQDSGFSTETSSKDNSASTAIPRQNQPDVQVEDELWNLLDVIHRKGIRLREEVESLQGRLETSAPDDDPVQTTTYDSMLVNTTSNSDVLEAVKRIASPESVENKKSEEEFYVEPDDERISIDRIAQLEAETISSRKRTEQLQSKLVVLSVLRDSVESGLLQSNLRNEPSSLSVTKAQATDKEENSRLPRSCKESSAARVSKNRFRTRTIEKNVLANVTTRSFEDVSIKGTVDERRKRLGALDSILISPMHVAHIRDVDSNKIAAILRERSPLELQRHLITSTVHNQALKQTLDEVEKSLSDQLDKAKEENDNLRFKLAERDIELAGTRAQVRVLERGLNRERVEAETENADEQTRASDLIEHESASSDTRQSVEAKSSDEVKPSPRRRPSRIPLPGSTKVSAPKAPNHGRHDSGSRESLKSLSVSSARQRPESTRDYNRNAGSSPSWNATKDAASKTAREAKTRESSRESLNRSSLSKSSLSSNKDSREQLSANSSRDYNSKSSSLSRTGTRESNEPQTNGSTRRSLAPRRSYSLARTNLDTDTGKILNLHADCSHGCGSFRHSDSSLFLDSLNEPTSTDEFLSRSPERMFSQTIEIWNQNYFDSIDHSAIVPDFGSSSDQFLIRRGEAMAECDSLERHSISSDNGS